MSDSTTYQSLEATREKFLRWFLQLTLLVLLLYFIFDIYHHIYAGAITDAIAAIALGISFFSLCQQGLKAWHIRLTVIGGLSIFSPLLVFESFGDTGIYWLPTLPVFIFMFAGSREGKWWLLLYFGLIFLTLVLSWFGWLSLLYSLTEIAFALLVTTFLGIITYAFARYLESTEAIFLSQQKQLEAALKQAQAGSQAKSLFLSTMSHDLRTPLHGIIGMQELLAQSNQGWSEDQKDSLQLSLHASKSLKDLLNDVLDLAKIEANQMSLQLAPLHSLTLLRESLIPFLFQAREKGLAVHLIMQNCPTLFMGDATRLRQVLFNLLSNAIKFTDKGSITLTLKHEPLTPHHLIFAIQDTGIGIADDEQADIFEPFHQCANHQSIIQGTGLGTSIIQQSVALMGGEIHLKSSLGEGSCFTFTLPLTCVDDGVITLSWDDTEIIQRMQTETKEPKATKANLLHILLVEDDPIGRKIACKSLQHAGMVVEMAEDGETALQLLQSNTYDVMLTDIRMPKMDGIELTQTIRRREQRSGQHLTIIGLSAHALTSVMDEALAAGMDDFLAKPIEPEAILTSVLNHPRR